MADDFFQRDAMGRQVLWGLQGFSIWTPDRDVVALHLDFLAEDQSQRAVLSRVQLALTPTLCRELAQQLLSAAAAASEVPLGGMTPN